MKLQEHEVVALIRKANPVAADDSLLDGPAADRALLRDIETRRETMTDTSVVEIQRPPEPPRRRRALLWAAAALVVLVAGTVAILIVAGDEDAPDVATTVTTPNVVSTTTPPPPTTAPQAVDTSAQSIGVAEAFYQAWTDGDYDLFISMVTPEYVEEFERGSSGEDDPAASTELARSDFTFWYLLGTTFELSNCTVTQANAIPGDILNCQVTELTEVGRVFGADAQTYDVRIVVDDGLITESEYLTNVPKGTERDAFVAFADWAEANFAESEVPCLLREIPLGRGNARVFAQVSDCAAWIVDGPLQAWAATL